MSQLPDHFTSTEDVLKYGITDPLYATTYELATQLKELVDIVRDIHIRLTEVERKIASL